MMKPFALSLSKGIWAGVVLRQVQHERYFTLRNGYTVRLVLFTILKFDEWVVGIAFMLRMPLAASFKKVTMSQKVSFRIVLIDVSHTFQVIFRKLLSDIDCELTCCASGQTALAHLAAH
jgi:hypothetical protein